MATKKTGKSAQKTTPLSRDGSGTLQLTFTIPWDEIDIKRNETLEELAKNVEVPGFRRGMAPVDKARERLDPQYVIEKTMAKILPKLFADAIVANKLTPAMYPKFELLHAHENEDWEVRATTAELPEFELGDYQKVIKERFAKEEKAPAPEQKENLALEALQTAYTFAIPKILIEEEVNSRLASLLERLEKLGLSLESYLASINKTSEALREEYGAQAESAIRIDIVLGAIAQKEKMEVSDAEADEFMKIANAASPKSISAEQKSTVNSFLIKRKVLDKLASI